MKLRYKSIWKSGIEDEQSSFETKEKLNLLKWQEAAAERAEKIFGVLDVNSDGELNEDEFIRGCLDDDDLVNLLNAGGCDPDDDYD